MSESRSAVTDSAPSAARPGHLARGRSERFPQPTESNVSFVGASMESFRLGDLDSVRRTWAYDIVWHAPGNHPLAGDHRGADAIFAYLAQLFERSAGTFDPRLIALEARGPAHVEARFHNTATRWSRQLDVRSTLLVRISHGNIAEITEEHADQAVWDEFWSDDDYDYGT